MIKAIIQKQNTTNIIPSLDKKELPIPPNTNKHMEDKVFENPNSKKIEYIENQMKDILFNKNLPDILKIKLYHSLLIEAENVLNFSQKFSSNQNLMETKTDLKKDINDNKKKDSLNQSETISNIYDINLYLKKLLDKNIGRINEASEFYTDFNPPKRKKAKVNQTKLYNTRARSKIK